MIFDKKKFFQTPHRIQRILFSCFLLFEFFHLTSYAQEKFELPPEACENLEIASVQMKGLVRTQEAFVFKKIDLLPKTSFQTHLFKNSLQNLKNLQIFSKINVKTYKNKKNQLDIIFEVEEKWTLLPYFLLGSGGGVSYLVIGLYDTNFLGQLYTLNFTYGCKNENCSTFLFFRNPSIFGSNFNLANYITQENNVFHMYNPDRSIRGSFTNKKEMFNSYTDFKINPSFLLGIGFLYQKNSLSSFGLTADHIQTNLSNKYVLPAQNSSLALETRVTLGKIDYDQVLQKGAQFVSILNSTGSAYKDKKNNYTSLNNTLLFYFPYTPFPFLKIFAFKNAYFALRSNLSLTSSEQESQYYFVGGLDKVRGFYDVEFSGKYAWFTNFEYRIPSFINEYFMLQHAFFVDSGFASNTFFDLFSSKTGMSLGTGIRIVPLKINRVALRFDYATLLNPLKGFGINFGLLQFF